MEDSWATILAEAAAASVGLAVGILSLDGAIIEANRALQSVLNASPGDLVADRFRTPPFSTLTDAAVGTTPFEGLLTLGDGRSSGVTLRARVELRDDRLLVVAEHDVREQERLSTCLIELNQHANNLQRELIKERHRLVELNRQKDRFLGVAAHDLRNPLGSVRGYAQMLQLPGLLSDDEVREAHEAIVRSAEKMLGFVEDLLDLAAIERGSIELQLEEVDLAAFLARVCSLNRPLASNTGIELLIEQDADVERWRFDPQRVEQVVDNLLSNAFKFSHGGTQVCLAARSADDGLEITVRDQGQGIPPDEVGGVFGEFAKSSTAATGGETSSGLGLAICRRLIELHGGTISVRSELGVGSTFRILLPR